MRAERSGDQMCNKEAISVLEGLSTDLVAALLGFGDESKLTEMTEKQIAAIEHAQNVMLNVDLEANKPMIPVSAVLLDGSGKQCEIRLDEEMIDDMIRSRNPVLGDVLRYDFDSGAISVSDEVYGKTTVLNVSDVWEMDNRLGELKIRSENEIRNMTTTINDLISRISLAEESLRNLTETIGVM